VHFKKILFVTLFSAILFSTTLATGQMSANPPRVAEKIREMGSQLNPDVVRITNELHAPLLAEAPKDGIKVTKDEKYGADERNRLDLQRDTVYYGKDESKYPAMSVIKHVDGRKIPVFIVIAELDIPSIHYQNRVLIDALYERNKALPAMKLLIGHNHISEVTHFNTKDESIGPDILEFMKVNAAKDR
jgi:hypothetical protein